MVLTYVIIGLLVLCLLACVILINIALEIRNKLLNPATDNGDATRLQLNAYERLSLLAERSRLQNLVSRTDASGEGVASLHMDLINNLKEEYEHNIAQQVYVSGEVWNAVTRLKDQHIYIINQLAATLPAESSARDLKKRILEYTLQETADLNTLVQDAIRHETKKLL